MSLIFTLTPVADQEIPSCSTSTSSAPVPKSPEEETPECCICVETALHPVVLPCSHVFCFLCIKGVFLRDSKCPLCRAQIPPDYIKDPKLLEKTKKLSRKPSPDPTGRNKKKSKKSRMSSDATHSSPVTPSVVSAVPTQVWFYKGRGGGWWQYDERTNAAIDQAVAKGESSLEVLIAGNIYVLDFVANVQLLKDNPMQKREIKQDLSTAAHKGIAGLNIQ